MKSNKREVISRSEMVRAVKNNIKEFNVSESVIDVILKAYFDEKREFLLQGKYIYEDNISTEGLSIRGVSRNFSEEGFTVKLKASPEWGFRDEAMDRMKNNEKLQEVMDFDTKRFLNEEVNNG